MGKSSHYYIISIILQPGGEIYGMSSDLYQELGERGLLVKINISNSECDSFQGEVIRVLLT